MSKAKAWRDQVIAAFAKFQNEHRNGKGQDSPKSKLFSTKEINDGARKNMSDGSLHGWCVSDFAKEEAEKSRSVQNPTMFHRERRGWYTIL